LSNHTDNRKSAIDLGAAGSGAVETGALGLGPDADGSVVTGSVVGGREVAVDLDGTGPVLDVGGAGGASAAGSSECGASVLSVATVGGGRPTSPNAGPADAARQSATAESTAPADVDNRDISSLLLLRPGFPMGHLEVACGVAGTPQAVWDPRFQLRNRATFRALLSCGWAKTS
jgi:hypothetical protein